MIPRKITIRDGKTGKGLARTSPGARIFSIADSKELLSLSESAQNEKAMIELGKKILTILEKQDSQPITYTNP